MAATPIYSASFDCGIALASCYVREGAASLAAAILGNLDVLHIAHCREMVSHRNITQTRSWPRLQKAYS